MTPWGFIKQRHPSKDFKPAMGGIFMNPAMTNSNSLPVEVILMILDCFEDDSTLEIPLSSSIILPLLLLLRTLISSPDLAAHVLSLEIDDAAESDEESEPDSPANFPQARKQHVVPLFISGAEIAVVTEEVRNLNVPWQDAAPSILETTDAGVLSVLLMSFTPNLYHFSIDVDHRHPGLLLNLAKRLGDGGSRPLG
ncbi:hypothetical protein AFLA_012096 [Aspergillus flavus NRRL3357]|nr:uncharacterized protein G4B84_002128 [Aspergillus flavus NRRL3357]KAF7631236.1 hypothetical protein AFLA_012096 [Aspergillus flavus NRRL3357]QMW26839.1 hypothetical protein G4B84_002128 [Aspergillus flavus NRRL3357]QMW38919.1 hypothetical protein G4B11_002199 [Aspergillus flavus]